MGSRKDYLKYMCLGGTVWWFNHKKSSCEATQKERSNQAFLSIGKEQSYFPEFESEKWALLNNMQIQ